MLLDRDKVQKQPCQNGAATHFKVIKCGSFARHQEPQAVYIVPRADNQRIRSQRHGRNYQSQECRSIVETKELSITGRTKNQPK